MFKSNEFLYINAIKYDNQLKLDYKKLENELLVDTKNFVHLVDDEILSKDIAHKINLSQEEILKTYISTLLVTDNSQLVRKDESIDIVEYEIMPFNELYDIAIEKTTLFETKHYFNKTGVDFIYSSYHILNLHLEQNICKNEFLMFMFNNRAFIFITSNEGSIIFTKNIELSSFENIKESKFYEDDIVGQKLFDEMYYLEMNKIIKETLEDFYSKETETFIEKVAILYAVKQLESDDIDKLSEELLLNISYHPINVDEEIFELSKDIHQKKSFIKPRKKVKKSNNKFLPLFFAITILSAFAFYKFYIDNPNDKKQVEEKIMKNKKVSPNKIKKEKVELPDFININKSIEKNISLVLASIPYDVVLKDITFFTNALELNATLLKDDTFIKSLNPELENFYESLKVEYKQKDKKINLDGKITANGKQNIDYKKIAHAKVFANTEFLPIKRVSENLKELFPHDTILKFKETKNSTYKSFVYYVNVLAKSPMQFYNILDNINKQDNSITLEYPVKITKIEGSLEIEFILVYNQGNN